MHNTATNCASAQAAGGDGAAKFFAEIANGLHAMAQPLTILRASMEVLALPPSAGIDQGRYREISAAQLQRTCDLFAQVQDLVAARSIAADRSQYEIWSVIAPLIDAHRNVLQAGGVGIAAPHSGPWEPIMGDARRTEHAIAGLLQMAGDLAVRGDVIEISGSPLDGFLEVTIENTRRHNRKMNSSARLSLALAKENILSQQGRYELTEDPFRVSLGLPVGNLGGARSQPSYNPGVEPVH